MKTFLGIKNNENICKIVEFLMRIRLEVDDEFLELNAFFSKSKLSFKVVLSFGLKINLKVRNSF